ncbi:MAG TPA: hypothetical protein VGC13_20245 [Longimicrobium sp.]|jgi:hypothetical protein|uniref:hypothetical protein n=1 Tax=Longimicrobium sp. TaxID=2029185 RepID=UPI002ED8FA0E
MAERGLYKFGGLLLIAILVISAVAYATSGGRPAAEATPAALDDARTGAAPLAQTERDETAAPAEAVCAPDGAPRPLDAEIHESSGVAVSRAHAGIFWTHNDSGDPLLYAVDAQGRTAGRVRVAGASVEDWEDVALAPCPASGDCLYVADIGDNDAERASITVYRIPEPAPGASQSAPATAIRLRYPDGAHDAEALFVLNGAIHVVTKGESGPVVLYRAPADAGAEATLQRVRALSADKVDRQERITAADASPDGRWIVLRTLHEAAFYPAAALAESGPLSPRRVDLHGLDEKQGEGIGFGPDGSVYLTSEGGKKNARATFARLSCTLP